MSPKLTIDQLREAKIRMEGEHAIKRKIKDKIMRRNPKGPCACCGKPSEGGFSIHRDGFCDGPEVPLCNECGDSNGPNLDEIWRRIRANRAQPVMDIEDDLTRVKAQRDILLLACEAVREWSAIPISHPNGGTWYFAEEVAPKVDAAILFAKNK